jgi:hypothetical protein
LLPKKRGVRRPKVASAVVPFRPRRGIPTPTSNPISALCRPGKPMSLFWHLRNGRVRSGAAAKPNLGAKVLNPKALALTRPLCCHPKVSFQACCAEALQTSTFRRRCHSLRSDRLGAQRWSGGQATPTVTFDAYAAFMTTKLRSVGISACFGRSVVLA